MDLIVLCSLFNKPKPVDLHFRCYYHRNCNFIFEKKQGDLMQGTFWSTDDEELRNNYLIEITVSACFPFHIKMAAIKYLERRGKFGSIDVD
ncbi:hypothetical protein IEQ34_003595 [Dendrobium chrysotoxum]|uniref:Uncharacterized protein n=1 Tax=Dendrobium chrysotoxum TaxID=161865 RepID=A0AAV7HJL4_DENCH|nr:hypothetical protein IEQ34_003595 [Dendrobium chrysotoxum]